jgi:hypothetical protein
MVEIKFSVVSCSGTKGGGSVSADDWDAILQDLIELKNKIDKTEWIYIENKTSYLAHMSENQRSIFNNI